VKISDKKSQSQQTLSQPFTFYSSNIHTQKRRLSSHCCSQKQRDWGEVPYV